MTALVAHVAHNARMNQSAKDDHTVREHLEGRLRRLRATKGDTHPDTLRAEEDLYGPAAPPALEYLLHWSDDLHGRSGVGPAGFAPLTPTVVRDWFALVDREIAPHEVRALMTLDAVRNHPPKETDDG